MYQYTIYKTHGRNHVAWSDNYEFSPEKREIQLYDEYRKPMQLYSFLDDVLRIDIFDPKHMENGPIQTFLKGVDP